MFVDFSINHKGWLTISGGTDRLAEDYVFQCEVTIDEERSYLDP